MNSVQGRATGRGRACRIGTQQICEKKHHQPRKEADRMKTNPIKTQIKKLSGVVLLALANAAAGAHPSSSPPPPADMVLIAAGSFDMGDTFGEGSSGELPVHSVYVSAFYMDQYEVTKEKW